MRLIALVSWFDEQAAWLAELVASLATAGVDHVVAVDGAYALYPHGRGNSGSEQGRVVAATALGAGMGCTVHQPAFPWVGGEVEKRSVMFALGHLAAVPDEDWLVVADADEVWEQPHGLRDALSGTELDVAEVMLVERTGHGRSNAMIRKCFRAQPGGIWVEDRHCRYVAADGRVLWDQARRGEEVEALTLMDVRVLHRPGEREAHRTVDRLDYYVRRRELNAEAL